jgi:hypothetical protein
MSEERISLKVHFDINSLSLQSFANADICQDTNEAMASFLGSYRDLIFEYLLKFGGTLCLKGPASGLKSGKWGEILSLATTLDPTAVKTNQIWKRLYQEGRFTLHWKKSPTFTEL